MEEKKPPTPEEIRAARVETIANVASLLSQSIIQLGPVFAATVAFSTVGPETDDGTAAAETRAVTLFVNLEQGAAHLAEVSDKLNQQHVEIQAELDKKAQEKRRADEEALRASQGGVVDSGGDGREDSGAGQESLDAPGGTGSNGGGAE